MADLTSLLISVVVCTYNRAGLLAGALESLDRQSQCGVAHEIIVVDNNSTDRTKEVVERFMGRNAHFRYEFQPRQGVVHAANRGWKIAVGRYVAFMDDDCRVPPDWLEVAKVIINTLGPAAFGGPYTAMYTDAKPSWYKDAYGSGCRTSHSRFLKANEFLDGTNMFFERSVLHRLGGFAEGLGMSGNNLAYGFEPEFQIRMRTHMPDAPIYYSHGLTVRHLVLAKKMSLGWSMRNHFYLGRYTHKVFFRASNGRREFFRVLGEAIREVAGFGSALFLGVPFRDRKRYPHCRTYLYEKTAPHLLRIGAATQELIDAGLPWTAGEA